MRIRHLAAVLLSAILPLSLPAQTPNPRIRQIIHDLQQVRNIEEVQLSPDGSSIAWSVQHEGIDIAPMANPTQVSHVSTCANGADGKQESLAWSPDSKTLAFLSECTEAGRPGSHPWAIFTVNPASITAAPHLVAALNGYAESLEYLPSGKRLSFLYVEGATRESGALAAMDAPTGVIGVEHIEVQRVATADPATGQIVQVTPANLHVYEYDWSPDSAKLAYIAANPPGEDNWWTAKLYTQPVMAGANPMAGGRAAFDPGILFDPTTTTGPLHGLQIAAPRWSPDGSQIAFIGGLMSDQGVTGGDIYVIPATGGNLQDITPEQPASSSWFTWIDNQNLGITEIRSGKIHLFAYNIQSQQELSQYSLVVPGSTGSTFGLGVSVSNANTIAFVLSSFEHPPEVWAGPLNDLRQITHINDSLKPSWGKSESIEWNNEGFHVQGWLLYPPDYDPNKKYPLIVYVHGGPAWANLSHWPSASYGAAPLASLGYFVLMPNPRGSYGEGEKFTQANRKDFGYGDLRDILAGVDTVLKTHPIDPDRVGITGWSYGGFMTMFAVTQTNRFHAAVAGAGISNWQSYYGENSIDEWMLPFFGASVYDDPAVYAKSSAINFIKSVKTPTLIVVGDRDGECPAPQSFEFWHALRDEHVPTKLVVYPNEGHGFVNPEHRIDVLQRTLDWFNQYMP